MFNVIELEENCPACGLHITSTSHCQTCNKLRLSITNRHDAILKYLIGVIPNEYRPNIVNIRNGNMPENRIDKRQPDIYFEIGKKKYIIDVAFCKDGAREKSAFD